MVVRDVLFWGIALPASPVLLNDNLMKVAKEVNYDYNNVFSSLITAQNMRYVFLSIICH